MVDSARNEVVVQAYHSVLAGLLKLVTGLTATGILLYALGWLRSYGYYDSFNAKWILRDVRIFELASQGIFPFSILFISLVISFMDVAQRFEEKELRTLIFLSWIIYIICLIIFHGLTIFGHYRVAVIFATPVMVGGASIATVWFGWVVLQLNQSDFKLNSDQIFNVLMVAALFGYTVYALGTAEGNRDKTVTTSTLPHVVIASSPDEQWRFLTVRNDMLYLIKLAAPLTVRIIKAESIAAIIPNEENWNKEKPEPSNVQTITEARASKAPSGVTDCSSFLSCSNSEKSFYSKGLTD